MIRQRFLAVPVVLLLPLLLAVVGADMPCERLQPTLEYTQEQAPDTSRWIGIVTQQVNKILSGVVNVHVDWHGSNVNGRVGENLIKCKVVRLASGLPPQALENTDVQTDENGRQVVSQCFEVPFTVRDTDECVLPLGHEMRHKCQEPAICVNTKGSYECLCPKLDGSFPTTGRVTSDPSNHAVAIDTVGIHEIEFFEAIMNDASRTAWEVSKKSATSTTCSLRPSTRGCCPENAHSLAGQDCRAQFQCPVDPCSSRKNNKCALNAQCVRKDSPQVDPNDTYSCACPEGLLGSGRKCEKGDPKPEPKITFQGEPTDETVKKNYCGCTKPEVDACSGFPPCMNKNEVCIVGVDREPRCGCRKGFVKHEEYGCVDETPPVLKLIEDPRGDKTLRLKQGESYEEYGVTIDDDNREDYLRSMEIKYSDPLPPGCLTHVGEFFVNYTVSTPWTHPSYVEITRRVVIEDIDECSLNVAQYERTCPELIPRCDVEAGAKCVNTVGSYSCECPKFTQGDGFLRDFDFPEGSRPEGYEGGKSCVDTSKPVIELKGPQPKVFKICPCSGIKGVMADKASDVHLLESQRKHYLSDIKQMIASTNGLELCATSENASPQLKDCVYAYDETYKGKVDLSDRVTIGDPMWKSDTHWAVPYYVRDDAGNEAVAIYRDIVVQEVDIEKMEATIRKDVAKSKQKEIDAAVNKALREERQRNEASSSKNRRGSMSAQTCPPCPICDASASPSRSTAHDKFDVSLCDKICDERNQQCNWREENTWNSLFLSLAQHVPPSLLAVIFAVVFVALVWLLRLFLPSLSFDYGYDDYRSEERARQMQNSVTYHGGSASLQQQRSPMGAGTRMPQTPVGVAGGPPLASMSRDTGSDFFLSPSMTGDGGGAGIFSPPQSAHSQQMNGNVGEDPNDIYKLPPIIMPSPRKDGMGSDTRRRYAGGYS